MINVALLLGLLASPAAAHLAMQDRSMYGYHKNNGDLVISPLTDKTFDQWFFHGERNHPPKDGEFLPLVLGRSFSRALSCGSPGDPFKFPKIPCESKTGSDQGALHTTDGLLTPIDKLQDVRGCALSIAYESDVNKLQPEDFAVISTNFSCPHEGRVDFAIPEGLPACPPGGCHCMWGWIHSRPAGAFPEMYTTGYRCNVTLPDGTVPTGGKPVPAPNVARKCPINKNNCTVGAKQMHYWAQKERNNNHHGWGDEPYYNADYGFQDGAQTSLWDQGDESGFADECDWAPEPQFFDNTWGLDAPQRMKWNGTQQRPRPRHHIPNEDPKCQAFNKEHNRTREALFTETVKIPATQLKASDPAEADPKTGAAPQNKGDQKETAVSSSTSSSVTGQMKSGTSAETTTHTPTHTPGDQPTEKSRKNPAEKPTETSTVQMVAETVNTQGTSTPCPLQAKKGSQGDHGRPFSWGWGPSGWSSDKQGKQPVGWPWRGGGWLRREREN